MKHYEALKSFTFEISPADIDDLQEILKLQYLAYQSEAELLDNPNIPPLQQTLPELREEFCTGTILKAVDIRGVIIGSVRFRQAAQTVYVGKLIVLPELQGRGVGTRLLTEVEQRCPRIRLELFTSSRSIRNIALYERCGYRKFDEKTISDKLIFVYLEKLPGNFIPKADCSAYLQADACVDQFMLRLTPQQ